MKKILLGSALLLLSAMMNNTSAQTSKGDWLVGGNLGFNTAKRNTEVNFSPNAGCFVVDNLAIGGNLLLDYSKQGSNKITSFGVGPFARYYFRTDNNNVAPLLHTSFNYLSTKFKDDLTSSTSNGINFFFGGGAAIFLSDNVSLDAVAGYDFSKYKNNPSSSGFKLGVGFQVYLHKRQIEKITNK